MFPLTPDQHHWLEVATEDEGWCSFTSCTPSRSRARTDKLLETGVELTLTSKHWQVPAAGSLVCQRRHRGDLESLAPDYEPRAGPGCNQNAYNVYVKCHQQCNTRNWLWNQSSSETRCNWEIVETQRLGEQLVLCWVTVTVTSHRKCTVLCLQILVFITTLF